MVASVDSQQSSAGTGRSDRIGSGRGAARMQPLPDRFAPLRPPCRWPAAAHPACMRFRCNTLASLLHLRGGDNDSDAVAHTDVRMLIAMASPLLRPFARSVSPCVRSQPQELRSSCRRRQRRLCRCARILVLQGRGHHRESNRAEAWRTGSRRGAARLGMGWTPVGCSVVKEGTPSLLDAKDARLFSMIGAR